MTKMILVLVSVLSFQAFAVYPVKPNPSQTPGDLCSTQDRDFSGYRYQERIPYCQRDVDRQLKSRIYAQYDIPNHCRNRYTIDHFYPLSMGGNNSMKNLWPEHKHIKALREDLELVTFEELRDGEISQSEALEIIEEAKMNPPVDEIHKLIVRGDDCDRAAMAVYGTAL